MQATCMAMGQAAGTAAAIQSMRGEDMDTVNSEQVRKALREQGAVVPE